MKLPLLLLAILAGCTRRDPAPEVAPSARLEPQAAPLAEVPHDAGPLAVEAFDGGPPDFYAWSEHDHTRKTPQAFCAQFLRDVDGAHAIGMPTPSAPTCAIRPAPAAFHASGPFLDARSMVTEYVHRDATELLVKTAAGWFDTNIEWDVLEIEGGSRPWVVEAPDRIEIAGSRILAYAAGSDLWWNEGLQNDGGAMHAEDRLLRGAYGCELGAKALACFYWDPTQLMPLGTKTAQSGFTTWSKLPWEHAHDLDFAAQWPTKPPEPK